MIDKEYLKRNFDLLFLVEGDTRLKRSGAYYAGPCPFCGGVNRFTLTHKSRGWRWHCRECANEMWNDAIAYVMKREQLDFVGAVKQMGGELSGSWERVRPALALIDLSPVRLYRALGAARDRHPPLRQPRPDRKNP